MIKQSKPKNIVAYVIVSDIDGPFAFGPDKLENAITELKDFTGDGVSELYEIGNHFKTKLICSMVDDEFEDFRE